MPAKWWERIRLDENVANAHAQIEAKLQYWPAFNVAKCKERVVRMHEYLRRMQRIKADNTQPILSVKKSKAIKRDRNRELRAKEVARLESTIERELMDRLKKGVYGEIYNLNQKEFDKAITKEGKAQELDEEYADMLEYVEGESEEEELEVEQETMADIEDTPMPVVPKKQRRGPHVEIEYEEEREEPSKQKMLLRR